MDVGTQDGFTIVELLVTTLVIGALCAIALPNMIGQRQHADDASAKSLARAGQIAMQSYAAEHDGFAVTRAELLDMAPELAQAKAFSLNASAGSYKLVVEAKSSHTFSVERALSGAAVRTCTEVGVGGCGSNGLW